MNIFDMVFQTGNTIISAIGIVVSLGLIMIFTSIGFTLLFGGLKKDSDIDWRLMLVGVGIVGYISFSILVGRKGLFHLASILTVVLTGVYTFYKVNFPDYKKISNQIIEGAVQGYISERSELEKIIDDRPSFFYEMFCCLIASVIIESKPTNLDKMYSTLQNCVIVYLNKQSEGLFGFAYKAPKDVAKDKVRDAINAYINDYKKETYNNTDYNRQIMSEILTRKFMNTLDLNADAQYLENAICHANYYYQSRFANDER